MPTVVNDNSQIYYSGKYWNDFPKVLEYMSENFTGNKDKTWVEDFRERFAQKPFQYGLFLNCGNGWVEREFIDKKIVKKAAAFDYSQDLLKAAEEQKGKRNIHYFKADVNNIDLANDQFDLIINVAALHHVQYINKLCLLLAKALKKDGVLVNFDYIGPSRNQYSLKHWLYIKMVNHALPDFIKKEPLDYPHLPTMLYTDPTEAIHSDLIIPSLGRYFDIIERHDCGGGIAYMILTHNSKLNKVKAEKLNANISKILAADKKYTLAKKVPPMFSYFIAKPNKKLLRNKKGIKHFQQIEDEREKRAEFLSGVYTQYDYLKLIKAVDTKTKKVLLKKYLLFILKKLTYPLIHQLK